MAHESTTFWSALFACLRVRFNSPGRIMAQQEQGDGRCVFASDLARISTGVCVCDGVAARLQ